MPRVKNAATDEADRTWGPFSITAHPSLLEVDANGGTVTMELRHAADPDVWLTVEQFTADTVKYVSVAGMERVRLTATGSATFAFVRPA